MEEAGLWSLPGKATVIADGIEEGERQTLVVWPSPSGQATLHQFEEFGLGVGGAQGHRP